MSRVVHPRPSILTLFVVVLGISSAACFTTTTTTTANYTYYDPYVYYAYYPADLYYAGYYWTDPYSVYYYQAIAAAYGPGAGGAGGGGVTGGTSRVLTAGDAIRALALGEEVCPNQVTVTPRTGANVCGGDGAPSIVRNGVTIVFNGCMLAGGGRLDGTYDVQATRSASDTGCSGSTTISIAITTTITNLTYAGSGARKLVIPNETGTSALSYGIGQPPTSSTLTLNGHAQIYDANGAILTDSTLSGTSTVTERQDKTSYTTDGELTLQDQLASGTTTKLISTGLVRSSDCCHPTGGKLTINRTGAINFGTRTLSFGPSCGDVTFDNVGFALGTSCL